ncbi:hypothetical protein [Loigolactobacillus bifermentans]|uniref:Uncharacterized protein n=1 Tax=Loigolactobacillus bifermentans DSM 20003 TaxID=1423726 RepID=A0A0R1GXW8_9LACO|nr:hypothetical protein [Loigolactobacillus bifermentans]KRK38976.1 hypothetical protein FC07_GL002692 [Loigolactobacillus bifermentans DSM 20003]QGG59139.1 hypothetical protein LB003_00940 [Loigolactobacillus bifermentans]
MEQVQINAQTLINKMASNHAVEMARKDQLIANLQVTNEALQNKIKELQAGKDDKNVKNN